MKPRILLAIDPGQMTGVCAWDLDGNIYDPIPELLMQMTKPVGLAQLDDNKLPKVIPDLFFHCHIDKMSDFMAWVVEEYTVEHLVVEHYILYGRLAKQQSGSNMPASRIIGRAEMLAKLYNIKLDKPRADKLPSSLKHAGITMPKSHKDSHRFSAYAHGYEYMITHKLAPSALMIEKGYLTHG